MKWRLLTLHMRRHTRGRSTGTYVHQDRPTDRLACEPPGGAPCRSLLPGTDEGSPCAEWTAEGVGHVPSRHAVDWPVVYLPRPVFINCKLRRNKHFTRAPVNVVFAAQVNQSGAVVAAGCGQGALSMMGSLQVAISSFAGVDLHSHHAQ
jgi:hypothetical protein